MPEIRGKGKGYLRRNGKGNTHAVNVHLTVWTPGHARGDGKNINYS